MVVDRDDLRYEKLLVIPSCDNCGLSFPTQEALDTLSFSHTFSVQAEIYCCPSCGENEVRVIRESEIEPFSHAIDTTYTSE
jgi:Zn finger protein HypA/HybF involved in hydrogenase expression